jgi:hypothetical protein
VLGKSMNHDSRLLDQLNANYLIAPVEVTYVYL